MGESDHPGWSQLDEPAPSLGAQRSYPPITRRNSAGCIPRSRSRTTGGAGSPEEKPEGWTRGGFGLDSSTLGFPARLKIDQISGPAFLSDSSYTALKAFPGASRPCLEEMYVAQEEVVGYLKTAEVADMLHVSPKTVTRWAKDGKLPHSRTLGGHRRFPAEEIRKLAAQLVQVNNL